MFIPILSSSSNNTLKYLDQNFAKVKLTPMKSCKIRSNGLCRHASIQTILITFALLLSQKDWEQENNWEDFWSCNLLIIILSLLLGPLSEILRLCYLLKVHNIKKHVSEIVGFWLGSQIGCSYMVYWQFFLFFLWVRLYTQYGTSEFMSMLCSAVVITAADWWTSYQTRRCLRAPFSKTWKKGTCGSRKGQVNDNRCFPNCWLSATE